MIRIMTAAIALGLASCGQGGETPSPGARDRMDSSTQAPSTAPTIAGGGSGMKPESRQFRDWRAVCDNGNRCVAWSGTDAATWMLIRSEAGASTDRACIGFGIGFTGQADTPNPVILSADGRRLLRMQGADGEYCADGLTQTPQDALIRASDARTLTLAGGGQEGVIPAAGLKAALLWIDERQDRLDTETALIRVGDRPSRQVPPPAPLPVIVPAPPVSQAGFTGSGDPSNAADSETLTKAPAALEAVPAVQACRANTASNVYVTRMVTASRLDASTELWGVPCDSGAYNVLYAFFLTGPGGTNARSLRFDVIEPVPAVEDSGWLMNPIYDPKTRTLTAVAKGRGLGDCGYSQSWTWTGRGFALSREQVMKDCFGMSPELWPTTFRSR